MRITGIQSTAIHFVIEFYFFIYLKLYSLLGNVRKGQGA